MAKTLQFRRDTTTNLASESGALAEIFMDTDKNTLVVMDGSTAGGFPLAKEAALSSLVPTTRTITVNGNTQSLSSNVNFTISSSYSNVQVASYLPTHTSNVGGVFVGNVQTDNYFYANGSPVSFGGGGGSYSNVQVATYLPTHTGNIGAATISASGLTVSGSTAVDLNSSSTDFNLGLKVGRYITGQSGSKLSITNQSNGVYLEGGSNAVLDLAGTTAGLGQNAGTGTFTVLMAVSEFRGTAQSTSTTTGALRVSGGVGIAGNVTAGGNLQAISLGIGTAASGTTGEIRATDNVTAYYSSDRNLKENIEDIPNALAAVNHIGGKLFDWSDNYIQAHGGADGYFVTKQDFGVIAQDVQEVFPRAVKTREDGTLAVDYEKLCALAFAAIKELTDKFNNLGK
jgi:hypothetical protein